MGPAANRMRVTLTRGSRAGLAIALACGALLWNAAPAWSLAGWGIERPGAGARLASSEPVQVVAYVDHAPWEDVQRLEVRFVRGGEPAGVVRRLDPLDSREIAPGLQRSRFAAQLAPLSAAWFEFRPAPNGHYGLQARVQYAVQGAHQEPSPWSDGHGLVIDVPPPRPAATAAVTDPTARTVVVSWEAVGADMSDFLRYAVERAGADGAYQTVHESADGAAQRFTDNVPADGDYRYRVTAYRAGADGGERSSPSGETSVVSVHPGAEPAPDHGGGSEPGDGAAGGSDDATGGDPGQAQAGSGTSWRPLQFPSRQPRPAPRAPQASGPRTAPEDSTFSETLDYGEWPEEWEVSERQVVREAGAPPEGGTLTVFSTELELERVLVPIAGGLVLVMFGAHLARFLRASP
jgi:hypothetical protein